MAKRVLIVDDNPNMSSLLAEMLEVFDCDSDLADDGHQALTKLEGGQFSMIITDMRMPNMTGMELLKQVKSKYPNLPVVLISGYSGGQIEAEAELAAADGFLGKPLMMSDIEKLLNRVL